jgi:hypothetical protein
MVIMRLLFDCRASGEKNALKFMKFGFHSNLLLHVFIEVKNVGHDDIDWYSCGIRMRNY